MYTIWQDFLQQHGAVFDAHGQIDFIDQPPYQPDKTPLLCPLSDFAVLKISGDDGLSFLNGQFTNDLTRLDSGDAQISAWCNPQGRVISGFIVIRTDTNYRLICKTELKDSIQQRLAMFILRANVLIEDITDSCPLLGITNAKPPKLDKFSEEATIVPLPDFSDRYLIMGNVGRLKQQFEQLKTELMPVGDKTWALLDILAGVPWVTDKTREQFLPQTLNFDLLSGMSYQKGCYPGQEIIARLHYRGKVKKRVRLIHSATPLEIGTPLHADQTGDRTGTILNAAAHPNGDYYALAVITLTELKNILLTKEDQIVTVLDLPYSDT